MYARWSSKKTSQIKPKITNKPNKYYFLKPSRISKDEICKICLRKSRTFKLDLQFVLFVSRPIGNTDL